jgi:hypothetical protein
MLTMASAEGRDQTGWTELIARSLDLFAGVTPEAALREAKGFLAEITRRQWQENDPNLVEPEAPTPPGQRTAECVSLLRPFPALARCLGDFARANC